MAAWRGLELLILRVRFLEYGLFLAWARAVFMQGVKQSQAEGRMRREREERRLGDRTNQGQSGLYGGK
jgi:hypothetical protein